jgi:hypothetical protein
MNYKLELGQFVPSRNMILKKKLHYIYIEREKEKWGEREGSE